MRLQMLIRGICLASARLLMQHHMLQTQLMHMQIHTTYIVKSSSTCLLFKKSLGSPDSDLIKVLVDLLCIYYYKGDSTMSLGLIISWLWQEEVITQRTNTCFVCRWSHVQFLLFSGRMWETPWPKPGEPLTSNPDNSQPSEPSIWYNIRQFLKALQS